MAAFFGADEIWSRHDEGGKEPVILVGVRETSGREQVSEDEFLHSLDELEELAKACMMEPCAVLTQLLPHVNAGLYVGSGKVDEIRAAAEAFHAQRVIFNDTLSPSQIRNLQKELELPVMDRTALILEIFERRARTREAKLQVELAKLRYLKPRLIGMWETQNRQGGASGAMSAKGEGETQLEIDRRTIDHRLSELGRELKLVARERETQRKKRQGSGLPLVSLVGYTNAGKSTIMNAMLDRYVLKNVPSPAGTDIPAPSSGQAAAVLSPNQDAAQKRNGMSPDQAADEKRKVFEADMLFATLDTTIRKITVERGKEFLLSDTVGFIHKLPTALVQAFHSTLEEVTEADLLIQVVDVSDPHSLEQIEVTKKTIEELGAGHIPMITAFNKSDLADPLSPYPRSGITVQKADEVTDESIYISAKEPSSIEFLTEAIFRQLHGGNVEETFLIPYDKGSLTSWLMEHSVVLSTDYTDKGTLLHVRCSPADAERISAAL